MYTFSNTEDFLKQFYGFNRPFHESSGYWYKTNEDGSLTFFLNALGIEPSDVDVSVRSEYPNSQILSVVGKTHNPDWDEDFSVNASFLVRKPIKKITKHFQSGLITLKVEFNKPIQPDVEIVEQ